LIKRGEVYFDSQYEYPAGNKEDKFFIILNKSYSPPEPIIAVPVTTNKKNINYKSGCNFQSGIYYLPANEDFFPANTIVQLQFVNHIIDTGIFLTKKTSKQISFVTSLKQHTIESIISCLKSFREDIDTYLHNSLF
jgi:hypothetical protein